MDRSLGIVCNPKGIPRRSMENMKRYSPSQVSTAKHVSYPQLTATIPVLWEVINPYGQLASDQFDLKSFYDQTCDSDYHLWWWFPGVFHYHKGKTAFSNSLDCCWEKWLFCRWLDTPWWIVIPCHYHKLKTAFSYSVDCCWEKWLFCGWLDTPWWIVIPCHCLHCRISKIYPYLGWAL